jgi:hypothetical protein
MRHVRRVRVAFGALARLGCFLKIAGFLENEPPQRIKDP